MSRNWHSFSWKEANFRFCAPRADLLVANIKEQRRLLDEYIERHPEFRSSLQPIELGPGAPAISRRMHEASEKTGVGPMAAVAGSCAESAARAGRAAEEEGEIIVENGGDIFLWGREDVVIGLYAGDHSLSGKIALLIKAEQMPLAVCSSSGRMGHSLSLGKCDLATVVSQNAALADAAATMACNQVKEAKDVDAVLERVMAIEDVLGVLLVKDERVGIAGDLPELIRHEDSALSDKITRAPGTVL